MDWGFGLFPSFLPVIADWGLDKKSDALISAGLVEAEEFALLLLVLSGCKGKVEGTVALVETSGCGFWDLGEPRRADLLD